MLAGYDSDDSEEVDGDGKAKGGGSDDDDDVEGPSDTARLLDSVFDDRPAAEEEAEEADGLAAAAATATAASGGSAGDGEGLGEGDEPAGASSGGEAEEDEVGGEDEDDEEDEEESDDGRPLPSALKAFSMVDEKGLQKYKGRKEFVVETFKKTGNRRPPPSDPKAAKKPQVGSISSAPMAAGLRAIAQSSDMRREETASFGVSDDQKRAALQAMGLVEGDGGGDGGAGGNTGGASGGGKKRKETTDISWEEGNTALKKARRFAAQASGEIPEGDGGAGAGGGRKLSKGHILGLAQAELDRQRKEGP